MGPTVLGAVSPTVSVPGYDGDQAEELGAGSADEVEEADDFGEYDGEVGERLGLRLEEEVLKKMRGAAGQN